MVSVEDLQQRPYVRLLIPFIAGIIIQLYIPIAEKWTIVFFIFSASLLISAYTWHKISPVYQFRWVFGLILNLFLISSGCSILSVHQNRSNFTHFDNGINRIVAEVTEIPAEKPKSYKAVLNIHKIHSITGWTKTRGKAIAYFQKDSLAQHLQIGDQLAIQGRFQKVRFQNNPLEFNYRDYLFRHNIYCQMYIKSTDWKKNLDKRGFGLRIFSARVREKLLSIYKEFDFGEEEFAIAGALTLGFRDRLDPDLQELYVNAGVMHVLAISGLHVGILYFLLFSLLGFFTRMKRGILIRATIVILFLWFFAFLTGLSPSVMRAATMFSFITIGQSLNRPGNIYNTIAASAFFLLLINPYLIKEIGFQLSYTAVTGIIFFQPKFYLLFRSRFWLLDKLWGLITVSLAAQLSTFPVSIYYFHQFPNYFIISNIVAIPFVTVILYTGILVFLFSFWPALSGIFAWFMNHVIRSLNALLNGITNLPNALTEGISNTFHETILIYGIILGITFFLISRNYRYVLVTLISCTLIISLKTYTHITTKNQRMIAVYNIENMTAIGFIDGNSICFIGDVNTTNNRQRLLYYISSHLTRLHIDEWAFIMKDEPDNPIPSQLLPSPGLVTRDQFIYFYGKKICLIDAEWPDKHPEKLPYDLNFIILRNNPGDPYIDFFKSFEVEHIIFDSTVSSYREKIISQKCQAEGIKLYSVKTEGAWIEKL